VKKIEIENEKKWVMWRRVAGECGKVKYYMNG
jgi:hypothetical protein